MKKLLVLIMVAVISLSAGKPAEAVTRYATKTVALKDHKTDKAKTVYKVKACTKLDVKKIGKKWAAVAYKGQTLYVKKAYLHKVKAVSLYKPSKLRRRGRIRWRGVSFTWYTQRRLPDRHNYLGIKGRHLDKNGFVRDRDGYIVLASSIGYKKVHKVLPTPFGAYGKVYDTNGTWNYGWRDVYTNW